LRIAGRDLNLRFWVKTSIKVLLVLLVPAYASVEVDARLPGLEGYGGNYNCMLFTVFALHYSREVFITIRTPATILAAISICIPGIYFTRRLARQPKTTPIKDSALASGFATAFVAMYCVYGSSLNYELLNLGSIALVVLIFLPIFVREAELVGLANVMTKRQDTEVSEESPVQAQRMPRKYAIVGILLALAAFLTPYFLIVQTWGFGGTYRYQVFSLLVGPTYQNSISGPYWSFGNGIVGIDTLFIILFVLGARLLFAFGMLRYWRGMTSRTKVVLAGAIGMVVPAIAFQFAQMSFVEDTLVFSSPLPVLFLTGLLAIIVMQPIYMENLQILEKGLDVAVKKEESQDMSHKVEVPLFYALKSRAVLTLSRLRRGKADSELESEEQVS